MDVIAIDPQDRAVVAGECIWGADPVHRAVVCELTGKVPKVAPGPEWRVHFACFAHAGFTDATRSEAKAVGAPLADLARLDDNLRTGLLSFRRFKPGR